MPEREQIKRTPSERPTESVEDAPASVDNSGKLKAELDDLLDEIDEVLETNAEDFVRSFVQKGGE